jgi:hypothetical protein
MRRKKKGKKNEWENLIFSGKCSGKIVQGGYQPGSDTMLRNMTSMEKWRENYVKLCIDIIEQSYKWESCNKRVHQSLFIWIH